MGKKWAKNGQKMGKKWAKISISDFDLNFLADILRA
jgi:hypothetical protein